MKNVDMNKYLNIMCIFVDFIDNCWVWYYGSVGFRNLHYSWLFLLDQLTLICILWFIHLVSQMRKSGSHDAIIVLRFFKSLSLRVLIQSLKEVISLAMIHIYKPRATHYFQESGAFIRNFFIQHDSNRWIGHKLNNSLFFNNHIINNIFSIILKSINYFIRRETHLNESNLPITLFDSQAKL